MLSPSSRRSSPSERTPLLVDIQVANDTTLNSISPIRPRSPREHKWEESLGHKEWERIEKFAESRVEVDTGDDADEGYSFSWKKFLAYAGPGWLMSVAYVDPGNLESDLQSGAYSRFQLVWVLFWSTALGFVMQTLSARIGVVTGKNIAELCHMEYSRVKGLILWFLVEIAIIGRYVWQAKVSCPIVAVITAYSSDIQEVLGSAIAFKMLLNIPLWIGCLITALDTVTFLGLHAFGIRKLEAFFVGLIGVMLVCFCVNFVVGGTSFKDVAVGALLPSVSRSSSLQAVGIIGAVIMPHNIYLHSALVQSRQVDRSNISKVREANKYFAIESGMALFVSFLINTAVVGVFASGFFSYDCLALFPTIGKNTACTPVIQDISSHNAGYGPCITESGQSGVCAEIGLSDAGNALSNVFGKFALYVWAVGLLAAGQSSTMTGTYAGQFVMEGFLRFQIAPWKRVAVTRAVALIPAVTVAIINETSPNMSDALGEMLNVLQSLLLPFALLPVVHFATDKELMQESVISRPMKVVAWLITLGVMVVNGFLVSFNAIEAKNLLLQSPFLYVGIPTLGCLYLAFVFSLIKHNIKEFIYFLRGIELKDD